MSNQEYEAVIGLEVHAELKTQSKIFCACPTDFGAPPNTQCCPVCMGYPGTMPVLNRRAVELCIKAGLALGCKITRISRTDRKQYFYPDLPKAYQISQDEAPLCRDGELTFSAETGQRTVCIKRIHIEEDAGKLIHAGEKTLIDHNRCGVPLIEIVSAPDLRTPEQASAYLRALRGVLLACGVSDCRMQEGSLRCDVNVSLRKKGCDALGVRTEIKNLNSFSFVEKALRYEIKRQSDLLGRGEHVESTTCRFDPASGKTYPMRSKESTVDYRFLPEPDLPPICIRDEDIEAIRATLPELPRMRAARMRADYGLTDYDTDLLVSDPALADFFECGVGETKYPKIMVNLLLSDLLRHCGSDPFFSPVSAHRLAELATLLGESTVNSSTAKKLLLRLIDGDIDLFRIVADEGLAQIRDREKLSAVVCEVLAANPRAVADYRNGKTAALRALQGQAMARTAGRAEPVLLEELFCAMLAQSEK